MSDLFILGTGGQARDIAEIAFRLDWRPIFVTRDQAEIESWQGSDEIALEDQVVTKGDAAFAIGIGDNQTRRLAANKYRQQLRFPALIDPDSSLARGMFDMLSKTAGTVVFPGVRVMGGCKIGDFCTLNLNATVSHDCVLDDFVNLSPGAHLAGNVFVAEGAWVGMGVVVNQGTDASPRQIGAWSVVGSGAAVVHDVRPRATSVGVPAKEKLL
ncbi:PglD-related sugar-binding protein [Parerythrobacter jejuensis]|uniref:PglD N-terminal domain-containing protein n=1 Tax=Parerythrobacter jejuensis TaxID=795812 RepID=A0A845B3V5_9SPHN|nr:hypothetical protein [Parerythrobacter jejuensis]MXP30888.1 hypothetical protein [Parerythrobacter jejuensis]MXP33648.1 hypothetical protein [Parerythrobacter jejuensis]